jgi:DNA-binding IclR family transcriptional regulator
MAEELQREILDLLETHGQLDSSSIARLTNAHPLTINRNCLGLVRAGQVKLVSGGSYELTERGERQLGSDAAQNRRD